jgi:hypothetical protein
MLHRGSLADIDISKATGVNSGHCSVGIVTHVTVDSALGAPLKNIEFSVLQ